jgi:hypothetical protein
LVLPAAFRPPLCSCWEWNPDLALFRALYSARFGACLWRWRFAVSVVVTVSLWCRCRRGEVVVFEVGVWRVVASAVSLFGVLTVMVFGGGASMGFWSGGEVGRRCRWAAVAVLAGEAVLSSL